MPKPSSFSTYHKIIIFLLALTQFTIVLDFMVMSPLGDFLIKAMHISPGQFGIAVSAYAFSAGISGLLAAGFADRYDRKKLLLFFYSGFILGTLACGLATTYPFLIFARILTGLFGGVMGSVLMAIIGDVFKPELRGRVMGFIQMGFAASSVLGIPVGIYLANIWDWHAPFLMIVGLALLIFILVYRFMEPVVHHLSQNQKTTALNHFRNVLAHPPYQLAFLATALLSIGGFLMMPFGSAFAINNLKISPDQLPILYMATGIASLVIMPLVGRLSDRTNRFKIFLFGSVWASIFIVIYTNLPVVPLWAVIVLNILLFAGIMSRMIPASTIMISLPRLHDRGAFMSISSSLQQIAGGIAAAFAGLIVTQKTPNSPIEHYPTLGFISVAVMMLCAYLIYKVYLMTRQASKEGVSQAKIEQ
ncbi:MAG TPA: MFS transporter [Saprospiraceae bacterium]|nr:MFS transporter [Saprospiraceae bacterium]HNT21511.1 MFS transporter [Saprospiraceae bacterium]